MKNIIGFISLCFVLAFASTTMTSCSKKVGCPALDQHSKKNKAGMPKRKAKSGVFPKSMTNKQMKKKRIPKKRKG
jgi:hypothetical protein